MTTDSISPIGIVDELKQSYLDYAMSVIVSRALPDVRDGLKPVHRRVLYAMHELSNDYNKPYKKSARVVGDVIGKYHPHGDTAVYDAIVRLAQPFSMRYMLVDGQGNFGSVDDDPAAAMRYTEVRMQKFTHQMLADLDKNTVDWEANYDGSEQMPSVLPARIPNLLVNGATGIAVGMATNMAPHNLTEVVHACLAYADNPHITGEGLMQYITGPDFPTGGIIYGRSGIVDAYRTGKGRLHLRGKYHIEKMAQNGANKDRERIVFSEIPYQTNKAKLIEKIAELVRDKKLDGISEIRDESDKDGMRIAIDLKRGENTEVVVNNLFLQTPLESSFSINMVALDEGQPKIMTLRDLIACFIRHRQEVVTRRTAFELKKALTRGHLLEGMTIALANIDKIIETIKQSANRQQARDNLLTDVWQSGGVLAMLEMANSSSIRPDFIEGEDLNAPYGLIDNDTHYRLSPDQVNAILDMQLHRLTGLEQDKIQAEFKQILAEIAQLQSILADFDKLMQVIKDELNEVLANFGDERKTQIVATRADFTREDLIPEEQIVLTVSQTGYAKTQPLSDYQAQKRGGRGKSATSMKEDDVVQHLLVTSNHATVLFFTNIGKVYRLKAYEIPSASRGSKGRPIVNLLPLAEHENISAILALKEFPENHYIFMATAGGTVKRVALKEFENVLFNGKKALEMHDGDSLIGVNLTDGNQHIMLFSNAGKAIRFSENDVRVMGRSARGVRGMRVNLLAVNDDEAIDDDSQDIESTDVDNDGGVISRVVSLVVASEDSEVLCACANGYGKRTLVKHFTLRKRGSQGMIAIKTSERNGELVSAIEIDESKDLLLISNLGTLVRTRAAEVITAGRTAQGVKLIRLGDNETLASIVAAEAMNEDDDDLDLTEVLHEEGLLEE
ncbi:DNA gyrase subunit A [Moraxella macacae 0408225]|uniref:DNA gyrase subunit A n=1 Tax=Moraxella macacae 0408225 TaxID=1230338 RepID=L2F6Y1_9GAMM|nr:DNA gyrase subunit A [Moraxella macacae]ELA08203.1 DNA gyrase subunit A [Moraxella macacae 0408225]